MNSWSREWIWQVAMEQSARDCGCTVEQLLGEQNTVLSAKELSGAKKYYQGRHFCQMISYGHGTVAVVNPAIEGFVRQYLQGCRYPFSAFDTPHINCLHEEVRKYGQALCFLAEYFLPELSDQPLAVPDHLQLRLLYEDELLQLYPDKRFPMALGYTRTEPKKDVIAAVDYLGSEIVGVAGASDDCETMWQVGIDVLPTFRGRGYARALVDTLTREIMRLGKVPFYCTAWSNIASKRTAISCGYRDAWVELSVKENAFTEKMIHHSVYNR